MTVDELLKTIGNAFPTYNAKAAESWAPIFHAVLKTHEGAKLREAHVAVMARFKPSGRTPFPVPVEYLAELPSPFQAAAKKVSAGLDIVGHADRKRRLLDDWVLRQG